MNTKIGKPTIISLIVITIIVLSLALFPKTIYKIYYAIIFEECITLNINDTKILNAFLNGTYNGDISYWCNVREITPRFLHDENLNIPKELGKLTNLHFIDLSGKRLIGEIPEELGNLKNLKVLLLNDNKLSGKIPRKLYKLEKLEVVNYSNNSLILD